MYSRCRWSVWFMVFLSVLPAVAQTQASISGVVHDPTGAVIPGVTVTVTNPATNFVRTAISNEAGVYNFPSLQPGRYSIRVELPGFRTITQNDIELQVQQSARLDFTLQVGQVSETIEVSGAAALIATENATVGTVIENNGLRSTGSIRTLSCFNPSVPTATWAETPSSRRVCFSGTSRSTRNSGLRRNTLSSSGSRLSISRTIRTGVLPTGIWFRRPLARLVPRVQICASCRSL